VTGRRSDGHSNARTLPKPLRQAAIEHAKVITQQQMANDVQQGVKGKKKKKRAPAHLLNQGSPEFSELGDSLSNREEPIQIQFSAKEPSVEERRFADVIRLRLACDHEIKMYGDDPEYEEELAAAKTQWIKTNKLYKKLLQERIEGHNTEGVSQEVTGFTSNTNQSYRSAVEKLAGPKKRRRIVVDDDDGESSKDPSSTSRLQDGLYCKPRVDVEDDIEPDVLDAMRQFKEMEEDAADADEDSV
jgi:hypothetical protein